MKKFLSVILIIILTINIIICTITFSLKGLVNDIFSNGVLTGELTKEIIKDITKEVKNIDSDGLDKLEVELKKDEELNKIALKYLNNFLQDIESDEEIRFDINNLYNIIDRVDDSVLSKEDKEEIKKFMDEEAINDAYKKLISDIKDDEGAYKFIKSWNGFTDYKFLIFSIVIIGVNIGLLFLASKKPIARVATSVLIASIFTFLISMCVNLIQLLLMDEHLNKRSFCINTLNIYSIIEIVIGIVLVIVHKFVMKHKNGFEEI